MARPHGATRYLETRLGILSYADLAPHLAGRVAVVERAIADGEFRFDSIDEHLIREMHLRICGDLTPAFAGCWRRHDVQVGDHSPPGFFLVSQAMHEYAANLAERVANATAATEESLLELLAYAEGQLLYIHPFEDFNGRVTRLFLIELLYRLELPIINPATAPGEETQTYFTALRAWDRRDPVPLMAIWRARFERELE